MALIDSIISVSIVTQTASVARAGFGVPLVAGYHTKWPERVRTYTSLAGLADDGFDADDAIYQAARAIVSQNPKVSSFKIGRRDSAPIQIENLIPAAHDDTGYTITIDGVECSFTSGTSATVATICAGLESAVNAAAVDCTALDNTTDLDLTADNAGQLLAIELSGDGNTADSLWTRQNETVDAGLSADLVAIADADNDWYGLIIASQSATEIVVAAAWVEAADKLFVACSADSDILTTATSDIASTLQTSAYDRSSVYYSHHPHDYLSGAIMGRMFPKDAGSATWANKTVAGAPSTVFSATHIVNVTAKNCNYYTPIGGLNITRNGVMSSGEFADIIRGVDWVKAGIEENLFSLIVNNDKVPFVLGGKAGIESAIKGVLSRAATRGFLVADSISVFVPDPEDLSSADKIARKWTGVTFSATLQGAVHYITVQGVLSI